MRVDPLIDWPGKDGNPLKHDQGLAKFISCTFGMLDREFAARILGLAECIKRLPDVGEIKVLYVAAGRLRDWSNMARSE